MSGINSTAEFAELNKQAPQAFGIVAYRADKAAFAAVLQSCGIPLDQAGLPDETLQGTTIPDDEIGTFAVVFHGGQGDAAINAGVAVRVAIGERFPAACLAMGYESDAAGEILARVFVRWATERAELKREIDALYKRREEGEARLQIAAEAIRPLCDEIAIGQVYQRIYWRREVPTQLLIEGLGKRSYRELPKPAPADTGLTCTECGAAIMARNRSELLQVEERQGQGRIICFPCLTGRP